MLINAAFGYNEQTVSEMRFFGIPLIRLETPEKKQVRSSSGSSINMRSEARKNGKSEDIKARSGVPGEAEKGEKESF